MSINNINICILHLAARAIKGNHLQFGKIHLQKWVACLKSIQREMELGRLGINSWALFNLLWEAGKNNQWFIGMASRSTWFQSWRVLSFQRNIVLWLFISVLWEPWRRFSLYMTTIRKAPGWSRRTGEISLVIWNDKCHDSHVSVKWLISQIHEQLENTSGRGSGRDVFSVTIFHLKVYLLWKKMYYLWGKNTFRLHVGRKMKSMRTLMFPSALQPTS